MRHGPEGHPPPAPGFLITFEGGEGGGKSTQVAGLGRRLSETGAEVVMTREPGGSPRAEAIRNLLLSGKAETFGAFAEAVLFAAARADHVEQTIRPALSRGALVICDRFIDSTRVYQGLAGGVGTEAIEALERAACGPLRPDITLVLDLPPESGLSRATARRADTAGKADRFEALPLAFHDRVRQAFLALASREPDRCVVIDADRAPAAVEAAVWSAVSTRLGQRVDGRGR